MNESPLPRISVVIPSYNQAAYIEATLLSVLGQGYPDLEVIVMDGGSTDQSVQIIERYRDRIAYWQSSPDGGQAEAINAGFQRATGEVFCWLNSDDMFIPGALVEIGRQFSRGNGELQLVHGAALLLRDGEHGVRAFAKEGSGFDRARLRREDYINQSSAFWTRSLWEMTGELNPNYHYVLDWDWFLRASAFTEFVYVPKVWSIYRLHGAQKSGSSNVRRRQEITEFVRSNGTAGWADLVEAVNGELETIRSRADLLRRLRVPKGRYLLPWLICRDVRLKLRSSDDLELAVAVLSDIQN